MIRLFVLIITVTAAMAACTAEKDTRMSDMTESDHKFTNHLEGEMERARQEDKPIFLSIGYAACHWCHVMERESFEDEKVAAILNEHYINIKVDREQRPDLDKIYMSFTTAMTGHGGWPMSVFLTNDLKPFYAGTYFPPVDGYGRPSFTRVITEIARTYKEDRAKITGSADQIFGQVAARLDAQTPPGDLPTGLVAEAAVQLTRNFDRTHGGFGDQPKFPHALELSLMLRHYHASKDSTYLELVFLALDGMANGGIYDHLGGGFARYSVDKMWLVPHFEKMLYDNGLLVPLYAEAYQLTGNEHYRRVIRETLDWMLREMRAPDGGFHSALDADSEGEEGKFYVWSKEEIDEILGDDAEKFNEYYRVTQGGNFEGHSILNITSDSYQAFERMSEADTLAFLENARAKLMAVRDKRIRPLTDDKVLTSWNGLALTALCRGYQVTGETRYLEAAIANAEFVKEQLYRSGKLTHSWREGRHSTGQFLEDYAYYSRGLIDLYESDPSGDNVQWLNLATEFAEKAIDLFADDNGVFYLRPEGQSDLIVRPRDEEDSSVPAPGSIMIGVLLKLGRVTENGEFTKAGEKGLKALAGKLKSYPSGFSSAVMAADYLESEKIEIILVGEGAEKEAMLEQVFGRYLPNRVIAQSPTGRGSGPLFEGREVNDGEAKAYLCRNSVCALPAATAEEIRQQLEGL